VGVGVVLLLIWLRPRTGTDGGDTVLPKPAESEQLRRVRDEAEALDA